MFTCITNGYSGGPVRLPVLPAVMVVREPVEDTAYRLQVVAARV